MPEPVAVADKPRDELAQVSMPPLAAAAVTLMPVIMGQSGVADK